MFDLLWGLVDRLLLLLLLLLLFPAGVVGGGEVLGHVRGEVGGGGGEGACTTRGAVGQLVSVKGILGKLFHFDFFAQSLQTGGNWESIHRVRLCVSGCVSQKRNGQMLGFCSKRTPLTVV